MRTFNSHNRPVRSGGLSVIVVILQKKMQVTEMNKTSGVEAQGSPTLSILPKVMSASNYQTGLSHLSVCGRLVKKHKHSRLFVSKHNTDLECLKPTPTPQKRVKPNKVFK